MTKRPALSLAFVMFALATAASGWAQPPGPSKRGPSPASSAHSQKAVQPGSAFALAYMAGNQPLVGFHAPSTKAAAVDDGGRPFLSLSTINRGESIAIRAASDSGGFAAQDMDRVAHLLRSATGDEHPIDPRTLSLVYRIQRHFSVPEIRVVSGYRVPKPGSRSNHGKGRAMDMVVPGVADEDVAKFARELGFTGVGVYPTSQFVHVDVRPRSYFWVDYSGPHMKNRERGILGDLAAHSDAAAVARGEAAIEPFGVATDVDAALRTHGMSAAAIALPAEEDDDDET
jgi:uncharacterized protein YcbK (DUF882 family)